MANLRLLIVDPDINYRTELRKQLVRSGIEVVGETDYGAEAVTLSQAQKPDAVAVAWQEPSARAEQTLESLSLTLPGAPLLAYSERSELADARRAIQAGAYDYLTKPLAPRDVLDAMNKALAQIERRRLGEMGAQDAISEGIVISLFGAKGGIGKTTMATNLAVAMAQIRHESVALLDIDTRFGDVAIVLDVEPRENISDIVQTIEEIDRFNIRSHLTSHSSGVEILPAPKRPSDWRRVQPGHIEKLIKVLAQTHDYVILDTPGFFTELVGVALDASDLILLVTTLDVSSLKDCSMAIDMLASADYPMDRIRLVVNHNTDVQKVSEAQVKQLTEQEIFWKVPFDKAIIQSGQIGVPVVLSKPRSKSARSIVELAYAISGGKRERKLFRRSKDSPQTGGTSTAMVGVAREVQP